VFLNAFSLVCHKRLLRCHRVQVDVGQPSETAEVAQLFSLSLPEPGQGNCAMKVGRALLLCCSF
jgi:hypothetical protein